MSKKAAMRASYDALPQTYIGISGGPFSVRHDLHGGVGFTMSLFIATLDFGEGAPVEAAKLGIPGASTVSGLAEFALLRRLSGVSESGAARQEAEVSA